MTVQNNADDGPGSLRYTIAAASKGDTIVFAHSLEGRAITLTSGALNLTKSLEIAGLGANRLTVSGNDAGRVFHVSAGVTATVSDLTIAHGKAVAGGGIDNAGDLAIRNSTLADNHAVGGQGGGTGGTGGSAGDGLGGGFAVQTGSDVRVNQSAIEQNLAQAAWGGAGGSDGVGVGGVYKLGAFTADMATSIRHNHASTRNDDIFL